VVSESALTTVRRAIAELIEKAAVAEPGEFLPPIAADVDLFPTEGPEQLFWTLSDLELLIGVLPQLSREKAIRDGIDQVAARWATLSAAPETAPTFPKLQSVRQIAAQATTAFPAGLEPADQLQLDWHLKLDQAETGVEEPVGTNDAFKLLKQRIAAQPVDVSAAATGVTTARMLGQIRRLHDILLRFEIAARAASASGLPLPMVLALYRQEGDLAVPPARNTLTGDDRPPVPGQRGDVRVALPPGRSNFPIRNMSPRVDLRHLVWTASAEGLSNAGLGADARDVANVQYHILIAGLDAMVLEPGGMKVWATQNRPDLVSALPPAEAARQAWKAFTDRWADLTQWTSTTGDTKAVTPRNTVRYTAGIVEEGARFLRRMRVENELVGGVSADSLPDILAYLNYHAYVASDPGPPAGSLYPRGYRAIVLSALVAAGKSNRVPELRQAIAAGSAQLRQELSSAEGTGAQLFARANNAWTSLLAPFLSESGRIAQLAKFIETASTADWGGWQTHRQNVIRFKRLLDFYRALLP
jgi:hypothetical protein